MDVVYLNRTSRILAGHLWVFSNELKTNPKKFSPGSLVELRDRKDAFLGLGYINPHSLIAVRILTTQREDINTEFFRQRIIAAIEYRKRFLSDFDSFRVVFSEGDLIPGLIVDKYADCLSVQILTMGMEGWTDVILGILDEIFSPSLIVLRNDSHSRQLEGLRQDKRIVKGALDRLPIIHEKSLSFEINPMSGQKTGFFLDQRENRIAFSRLVKGGEGLDLFCNTGAWGIHLVRNNESVIFVDGSETAISVAERNAELNRLSEKCRFIKADVFGFLKEEISLKKQYDFIVLDPPAFVKSKTQVKDALRGYREINANAMRILKKGGLLATSSCSYHIDKESFIDMLRSAARDACRQVRLIEMRSQAKDHPVLLSMPETEYLKCAFMEII
ncbi:MAG: class I SAM-dependent rRNA methyltransferase [Nitrospirota bacterium]